MEPAAVAMFERMKMLNDMFMKRHDCDDRPIPHPTYVADGDQVYLLENEYIFDVTEVLAGVAAEAISKIGAENWRLGDVTLDVSGASPADVDTATAALKRLLGDHKFATLDVWRAN